MFNKLTAPMMEPKGSSKLNFCLILGILLLIFREKLYQQLEWLYEEMKKMDKRIRKWYFGPIHIIHIWSSFQPEYQKYILIKRWWLINDAIDYQPNWKFDFPPGGLWTLTLVKT